MLQPSQLTHVSIRYADEIVELRDFLVKAGCAVRTDRALGEIATRLPRDRAFHRDLTSYVWVVIDRCDGISYSDLLGVLAVAAAGSNFAAGADEDDAHSLLHFLMDARHSLDALSGTKDAARGASGAVVPRQVEAARGDGQEVLVEPSLVAGRKLVSPEEVQEGGRKGHRWAIAAGCLLLALMIGLGLKYRPVESSGSTPAPVSSASTKNLATTPLMKERIAPPTLPDAGVIRAAVPSPLPRTNLRVAPVSRAPRRMPAPPAYVPSPAAVVPPTTASATRSPAPAEAVPAPAAPARAPETSTASLPATHATGPGGPAPARLPGTPNSRPARVASIPPDFAHPEVPAQQSGDAASYNVPVLHRRNPPSPENETNVASVEPLPAVRAAPGSNGNGSAGTAHGGTVHVTSLGIMAGNVLYSPVPAYPEAAYASHVQGEVRLSADVDRDGNVGSVRVISGPPLLRDAALDAVQRWRYRPFLAAGKPRPMSAIAVMDFELP